MTPKVLVTGANGFTGSNLSMHLAERGVATRAMYYPPDGEPDFGHENIEFVKGDLLDRDSLERAVAGVEVIYNIAALYRPMNVSNKMYRDVNVDGVRNIVEVAARAGAKRFVQCSTVGIHGTVDGPPADEDAPVRPDDYYQQTKHEGETLARGLGRDLGIAVSVARPAGIYGPRERRFLKLAKLIHSGRFIMFGDGEVFYHFVHIDDLCAGFVLCAEHEAAVDQVFILADAHHVTLNTVVACMADALGVPVPRLRLPYALLYTASAACELVCKPLGVSPPIYRRRAHWFRSSRAFDITRARALIGYDPAVAPEVGLKDMVRSFFEAGWLAREAGAAAPSGPTPALDPKTQD